MHYNIPLVVALSLGASALSAQSTSVVHSAGDGHQVLVDQQQAGSARVDIEQIGIANVAYVRQHGANDEADIYSDGSSQSHEVEQGGDGSNMVLINAFGSTNNSHITQNSTAGGVNAIGLLQTGTNNQAILEQQSTAAGLNSIALVQSGNDNFAQLSQIGFDNSIDLTQNGDANSADVTQIGNGLGFALTQDGGAQIIVTQTSPGG